MLKKIVSCAAAFVLALSGAQALPYSGLIDTTVTARAEETLTYGDFEYEICKDDTVKILEYNGNDDIVIIPTTIDNRKVSNIESGAFKHNENNMQTSFVIYDSDYFTTYDGVLYNKDMTILKCCPFAKTELAIPSSVKTIEMYALQGCAIEELVIPNNVTKIESVSMNYCNNLKSVVIPDSITKIQMGTFNNCTNLEKIIIPRSVKEIGSMLLGKEYGAFDNCDKLIIYCYLNSYAEEYAIKHNIPYILLDSHTHSYTSQITKSATCKEEGVKTYTCSCGDTYTEKIAKTAHKYTTKTVAPTYTTQGYTLHTCSVCGDSYKDNYKAKLTKTSIAKSTVTGIANKYYTGKAITQTPTVKLGSKTLKKGTDYTVTFKNNKAIGTATVTIKGKGNYTGTVTKTFKIIPKKTTLKTAASPKKGQLKVTYTKQTNITGYQITYALDKSFTKSKASKSSAKLTKTISGLKSGKTYYVKVRTYKTVKGTKYYSGYSAVKKIKVK